MNVLHLVLVVVQLVLLLVFSGSVPQDLELASEVVLVGEDLWVLVPEQLEGEGLLFLGEQVHETDYGVIQYTSNKYIIYLSL